MYKAAISLFIIATVLFSVSSQARVPPPPTDIYGKVHHKGKPIKNVLVEVMYGNCFSKVAKRAYTNKNGYYRINNIVTNSSVHIGVNGFTTQAKKKRFQATCKGVPIKKRGLNRHNIALKKQKGTKPPISKKEKLCKAKGGKWEYITRGFKGCNYTYRDGGKSCTDAKQCSAVLCLASPNRNNTSTGQCPKTTSDKINNCNGIIRAGKRYPKACP